MQAIQITSVTPSFVYRHQHDFHKFRFPLNLFPSKVNTNSSYFFSHMTSSVNSWKTHVPTRKVKYVPLLAVDVMDRGSFVIICKMFRSFLLLFSWYSSMFHVLFLYQYPLFIYSNKQYNVAFFFFLRKPFSILLWNRQSLLGIETKKTQTSIWHLYSSRDKDYGSSQRTYSIYLTICYPQVLTKADEIVISIWGERGIMFDDIINYHQS